MVWVARGWLAGRLGTMAAPRWAAAVGVWLATHHNPLRVCRLLLTMYGLLLLNMYGLHR